MPTTRITAYPYSSTASSVKVKNVTLDVDGKITAVTYTVTGGTAPYIGTTQDEKIISDIYTLKSAPLYIPSSVSTLSQGFITSKAGALEHYNNNLYFTLNNFTKKNIMFSDTNGYSGTLNKNIIFNSKYFTGGTFNNSNSLTIGLRNDTLDFSYNYGDEEYNPAAGDMSLFGVSPYAPKAPMLVLAGPSTTVKITEILPNSPSAGKIKYFFTDSRIFSGGAGISYISGNIPSEYLKLISVSNTGFSKYNLTQFMTEAWTSLDGNGYFVFDITPGQALSSDYQSITYNNPYAYGRISPSYISQYRKPVFRRLNGDDIDLTSAPILDGTNGAIGGFIVTDSENVLKVRPLADGSGSQQQQYFLRGDGKWGIPPSSIVTGQVNGNRTLLSAADPINPSTDIRTLDIQATYTVSNNGNLNIYATGSGYLTITGGESGLTLIGGRTSANSTGASTSISGVVNNGSGASSKGGTLYIDGGSGGTDAAVGELKLGTLTETITVGSETSTTIFNGKISTSSTGILQFISKGSTTPSSPGVGKAVIYVKDSSVYSGKLRLCIRAGNGTETTILDNISI